MSDLLGSAIVHVLVGLLGAVLLLECFARWKRNRDIEPGILFLLSAATAFGIAGGFWHSAAAPGGQGATVAPGALWPAGGCFGLAVFAAAAFFFKRRHRDIHLAAQGLATCFKTRIMKHRRHATERKFAFGYGLALFLAATSLALGAFGGGVMRQVAPNSPGPEVKEVAAGHGANSAGAGPVIDPEENPATIAEMIAQETAVEKLEQTELEPTPASAEIETASVPEPEAEAEPEPAAAGTEMSPASPAETGKPADEMAAETPVITNPNNVNPAMRRPKNVPKNVFATHIRPILQKNCFSCHGEEKQKGGLRLDTPEGIRKGGKGGAVIVAGDPEKSSLYHLTALPPDDPDIMPAKGKPLSKGETELLRKWILFGADLGDGKHIADASSGGAGFAVDQLAKDVALPEAALVESLKSEGVLVTAVSANQALLAIDFSHLDDKRNIDLNRLAPIAQNIHALDLSGSGVKDADLAALEGMRNLARLELNRTGIGDSGLRHLGGLPNLETLNLYGTQVGDAGLESLAGLKGLKKLYLWQSKATLEGAKPLETKIPGLKVIL